MRIPIFQVDAFTDRVFSGNPAAVCPLDAWLPDTTLQAIAAENNLSETSFLLGRGGDYRIRWFTPAIEVDLCGHGTLASAHVIFRHLEPAVDEVRFASRSGPLAVRRQGDLLRMDFPALEATRCPPPAGLEDALGARPDEVWRARDVMAVFENEDEVRSLCPDMSRLAAVDAFGVMATAPGRTVDFVSRFFAPAEGIPEDPVTGSAHCTLVPYWARRLGKTSFHSRQVSARGGELFCELLGSRVAIAGRAVTYLQGTIEV
jgi:PhzF family phenazine biosynthesis protein